MKVTLEHRKAGMIFLGIFALTAIMLLTSCSTVRGGCEMSRGYSGYGKTK